MILISLLNETFNIFENNRFIKTMTTLIISGIIIFGIYKLLTITSKSNQSRNQQSSRDNNYMDNSIIDVTGNSYKINSTSQFKKYTSGVPRWADQYVYSYSEIDVATNEQKLFYSAFKMAFLNNQYYDLEGNTNYAFILLFDLLNEYQKHKNIPLVERQFKLLGEYYPRTKSYSMTFLIKNMEENGDDSEEISRLRYAHGYYESDYWKLGNKYKTKLKLNKEEVILLNKLWNPSNNFCNIEYCCIEISQLYLATIAELTKRYIKEETTLNEQFTAVADIVARKHFKYRSGSSNYKYCIESTTNEFYSNIFKYCENTVRDQYGHKRKINTDTYYITSVTKEEFETRIRSKLVEILSILGPKISPPDEATEIELYTQNTNRWKIKFEEITTDYKDNIQQFIANIISLGELNKKNPSIENIFFEASKFISKYNKECALILYIHYIYHDLKSVTFDNKQLAKTIQKSLFQTNEQLHDFEIIVGELINHKNLEKAVEAVTKIYAVKRKRIQLDTTSIKEVQQQHSVTVELLNEYLKDEHEEGSSIKVLETTDEEIMIEIVKKVDIVPNSGYLCDITFTQIHTTALDFFVKSNFSVAQNEMETFAKSKGVFKNQLIESINDICYETLDDVLIEEEDEYYTINENYYQRLLAK